MFFVQIAGRLGKDPETRFTAGGQKVTTFSVAVNQRKGKEDVTTWIRITVWGDRFDKLMPYLKKGSGAIICGKMSPPSTYTDKEGRTQITLELVAEAIEFNPFGGKSEGGEQQQGQQMQTGSDHYGSNYGASFSQEPVAAAQPNYQRSFSPQQGQGDSYGSSLDDDNLPF